MTLHGIKLLVILVLLFEACIVADILVLFPPSGQEGIPCEVVSCGNQALCLCTVRLSVVSGYYRSVCIKSQDITLNLWTDWNYFNNLTLVR